MEKRSISPKASHNQNRAHSGRPQSASKTPNTRVRDYGIEIGILQPGPNNSIADVAGVSVGHATVIKGNTIRTGVTCVLPHPGNMFKEKVLISCLFLLAFSTIFQVKGAVYIGNGFGKIVVIYFLVK